MAIGQVLECSALCNEEELESELGGWVGICCHLSSEAPVELEWQQTVDLGAFAFWTGQETPAHEELHGEPSGCGNDWAAVQLGYLGSPHIAKAYSADGSLCAVLIGHKLLYPGASSAGTLDWSTPVWNLKPTLWEMQKDLRREKYGTVTSEEPPELLTLAEAARTASQPMVSCLAPNSYTFDESGRWLQPEYNQTVDEIRQCLLACAWLALWPYLDDPKTKSLDVPNCVERSLWTDPSTGANRYFKASAFKLRSTKKCARRGSAFQARAGSQRLYNAVGCKNGRRAIQSFAT